MYATHKHMGLLFVGWGGGAGAAVLFPEISVNVLLKIAYILLENIKLSAWMEEAAALLAPALYAYAAPQDMNQKYAVCWSCPPIVEC